MDLVSVLLPIHTFYNVLLAHYIKVKLIANVVSWRSSLGHMILATPKSIHARHKGLLCRY